VLLLAQKQCCVSSMDRYKAHTVSCHSYSRHRVICSSACSRTRYMRDIVLWGAQHSPVVPLGFSEFLTRVRGYNQDHPHMNTVRMDQAAAFYNRQSIVQILFRIPASQHKAATVKVDDPDGKFPNRKISLKRSAVPGDAAGHLSPAECSSRRTTRERAAKRRAHERRERFSSPCIRVC
jgi:hypothetical protein